MLCAKNIEKVRIIDGFEKEIPVGILATSPEGYAIVKFGYQEYAIVDRKRKRVEIRKTPYNIIIHAVHYMEHEHIVVSESEATEIMELVSKIGQK